MNENYNIPENDPFKDWKYFEEHKKQLGESNKLSNDYYEQIFNKAKEDSLKPAIQHYKTTKQERKISTTQIKVFICAGVIALGISVPIANKINQNKVTQITNEIAIPLSSNKQFGDVNPETGKPYWWYNEYRVYEDFDKQSKYSIDEQIYASYMSLKNEYHGMQTLNGIVKHLTGLANFDEFLKSKGYTTKTVKEWAKDMSKQLLEESRLTDNIVFEEGSMRGR